MRGSGTLCQGGVIDNKLLEGGGCVGCGITFAIALRSHTA